MRTNPQALQAQARLRVERECDAERECKDVVCDEIEEGAEMLTAYACIRSIKERNANDVRSPLTLATKNAAA